MTCNEAEYLLSFERDGALPETQRAALATHLHQCPSCRQAQAALADASEAWQANTAAVPTPGVEREWHEIRRRIRSGETTSSAIPGWFRPLALSLSAAAAVAVAAVFGPGLLRSNDPQLSTPGRDQTYVSYVAVYGGAEDAMIHEDPESGWLVVWVGDTASSGI